MAFDKLLAFMTKPWVILFYFGLVILFILGADKPLIDYVYQLNLRSHFPLLSVVTRLGSSVFYFPTFIGLILFFRFIYVNHQWEARFHFLLLSATIPAIICLFLKTLLGRARHNLLIYDQIYGFYGFKWDPNYWSCPSGHTTTIFSVILGLSILFPRYFVGFFLLGIFVALSRVMLTHHYLSDIMVAFYFVLIELGLLLYILRRKAWLVPAWQRER